MTTRRKAVTNWVFRTIGQWRVTPNERPIYQVCLDDARVTHV